MTINDTPMTANRLTAIKARTDAATRGPWRLVDLRHQKGGQIRLFTPESSFIANILAARPNVDADAVFLAHSRQDVEDLLAEVDRPRTPLPPGELRGLESLCAALHAATETDPVVKEVAWRTFALIRAHREQGAEVDRLRAELEALHNGDDGGEQHG